jgi:hypothetical protein
MKGRRGNRKRGESVRGGDQIKVERERRRIEGRRVMRCKSKMSYR